MRAGDGIRIDNDQLGKLPIPFPDFAETEQELRARDSLRDRGRAGLRRPAVPGTDIEAEPSFIRERLIAAPRIAPPQGV
jgi:hypothetical protein